MLETTHITWLVKVLFATLKAISHFQKLGLNLSLLIITSIVVNHGLTFMYAIYNLQNVTKITVNQISL